jgi:hypothetical protein
MARPPEFIPTVRVDITFKRTHLNDRRYVYGRPKHNEKRHLKVQYFTGDKNGRSSGTEIEFLIVFDYDPRERLRAWIGIGQLKALPYFVQERLAAGGIDLVTTLRKRFPVYRITAALWKLAVLDADTDVHHENNDCLDDRAVNLTPLNRLQHAQHHITVRREKTGKVNKGGGFKGFFDFRKLKEHQEQVTEDIKQENVRRKELGLEPVSRSASRSDRVSRQQVMLRLHRECCQEIGVK